MEGIDTVMFDDMIEGGTWSSAEKEGVQTKTKRSYSRAPSLLGRFETVTNFFAARDVKSLVCFKMHKNNSHGSHGHSLHNTLIMPHNASTFAIPSSPCISLYRS